MDLGHFGADLGHFGVGFGQIWGNWGTMGQIWGILRRIWGISGQICGSAGVPLSRRGGLRGHMWGQRSRAGSEVTLRGGKGPTRPCGRAPIVCGGSKGDGGWGVGSGTRVSHLSSAAVPQPPHQSRERARGRRERAQGLQKRRSGSAGGRHRRHAGGRGASRHCGATRGARR